MERKRRRPGKIYWRQNIIARRGWRRRCRTSCLFKFSTAPFLKHLWRPLTSTIVRRLSKSKAKLVVKWETFKLMNKLFTKATTQWHPPPRLTTRTPRTKFLFLLQICPRLNANGIQIPCDEHHKVSSLVKSHLSTNMYNSVKYEVVLKIQITLSNMKYWLNNTCVQSWT